MSCSQEEVQLVDNDTFYCVVLGRELNDECELVYCEGYDHCPYRQFYDSDFRDEYSGPYNPENLKVRPLKSNF